MLYIIGASRSGSTILSAVLGTHPEILAAGELNRLFKDDLSGPKVCACGEPIERCEFWSHVLDEWSNGGEGFDTREYLRLQDRFERFRQLPRLGREILRPSAELAKYGHWTRKLIQAIGQVGEAAIIADSSKQPPRAASLVLARVTNDLILIHLLRDPRAVAWSRVKYVGSPWRPRWLIRPVPVAVRAALDWTIRNFTSELLARVLDVPYVMVRYEDFVNDPGSVLGRIAVPLGVSLADVAARVAEGESFAFKHIVAGNQIRHSGSLPVIPDLDWHLDSPAWMRRLVWLLTGWLARHYGYAW